MSPDLREEVHTAAVTVQTAVRLETQLTGALSSCDSQLHSLLTQTIHCVTQLRAVPEKLLRNLTESRVASLVELVIEVGLRPDAQEDISSHVVKWHKAVQTPLGLEALGELYTQLERDWQTVIHTLKQNHEAALAEVSMKQQELIDKKLSEVDYAGVVRLATEDATKTGKAVLSKLAALEGRCRTVEIKLEAAEMAIVRLKRVSVSRKPTDPVRLPVTLFTPGPWSPRTPSRHHKNSRSISIRPSPSTLTSAIEHLDAMNAQVEALASLLSLPHTHQADSLQTCLVSYRFRTLLSGFERWRQVIA